MIVSLCLCLVLIFSTSYKEPAHAAEVTGPVIETAIEAALAALGVTVAGSVSTPVYKQIIQNLKTKAVIDTVGACTVAQVAGHTVYNVTAPFLQSVAQSFNDWMQKVKDTYTGLDQISAPLSQTGINVNPADFWKTLGFNHSIVGFTVPTQYGNIVSYSIMQSLPRFSDYSKVTTATTPVGNFYLRRSATTINWNQLANYYDFSRTLPFPSPSQIGFAATSATLYGYLIAIQYANGRIDYSVMSNPTTYVGNIDYYPEEFTVYGVNPTAGVAIPEAPGEDLINIGNKIIAQGVSILNHTADEVIGRIGDAVGVLNPDGTIAYPLNIPDGAETDTDRARDTDQTRTTGKDIATDTDRDLDDTTNTGKDTTLPKPGSLPNLTLPEVIFKDKFPFCLPWDLYTAFSNLAAPPQPPKWEMPFKIQSINFQQNVEIDFSQFNTLASILRWGLSVLFVIWLILLTRKIIGQ